MTEQEWQQYDNPGPMLEYLGTTVHLTALELVVLAYGLEELVRSQRADRLARKLRAFAVAVSRRVWGLLTDDLYRNAIEEAERFAEGASDPERLATILGESVIYYDWLGGVNDVAYAVALPPSAFDFHAAQRICALAAFSLAGAAFPDADLDRDSYLDGGAARDREFETHCHLLRCVFGNPFQSVAFDPAWRTPDVLALSRAAYDERLLPSGELDLARLAVLSDALEDADCTDADILDHLRSASPHVRGCWALDLCLDRV